MCDDFHLFFTSRRHPCLAVVHENGKKCHTRVLKSRCLSSVQIGLFTSCLDVNACCYLALIKSTNEFSRAKVLIYELFLIPVELYLSPIETHCSNIDYFPTIENGSETEESTRLHLARGVIALFILSFFSVVCAFFTGLSGKLEPDETFLFNDIIDTFNHSAGCWRRSAGAITATAILMLTACLLASGAMGLWHTVEFFEKEKVVGEEYFQQWPNVSLKAGRKRISSGIIKTAFNFRFFATIPASHTIGHILLHGLPLPANWSPQFSYQDPQCVSEVNARRKNN